MEIKVKKLRNDAVLPVYKKGNAGFDFHALSIDKLRDGLNDLRLGDRNDYIYPNQTLLVGTGLSFEFSEDMELQIRSRSGLSMKGLIVANSPGTIDSGYKGEVKIILINTSKDIIEIKYLDRLAQGVFCPIIVPTIIEVTELSETERGAKGFGSSGINN